MTDGSWMDGGDYTSRLMSRPQLEEAPPTPAYQLHEALALARDTYGPPTWLPRWWPSLFRAQP